MLMGDTILGCGVRTGGAPASVESSLSGTANDILKRNGEYLPQNAAVVDFDIGELVLHPLECQNRGGMGRMGRLDDG